MCGFISEFYSVSSICMSAHIFIPYCLHYYNFMVSLNNKLDGICPPTLLVYFKIILAVTDLLHFYISFRISSSIYIFLKPVRIFIGVALILYIYLGRTDMKIISSNPRTYFFPFLSNIL